MELSVSTDADWDAKIQEIEGYLVGVIKEEWLQTIADRLLELIRDEITSGHYETLDGTPVYGIFDTGRYGASFDVRWINDDEIAVGSIDKRAKLIEFGHAPEDVVGLKDEEIIKWVRRKKIARGSNAIILGKQFATFIRNNGISPRPAVRNALAQTIAENDKIAKKAMLILRSRINR